MASERTVYPVVSSFWSITHTTDTDGFAKIRWATVPVLLVVGLTVASVVETLVPAMEATAVIEDGRFDPAILFDVCTTLKVHASVLGVHLKRVVATSSAGWVQISRPSWSSPTELSLQVEVVGCDSELTAFAVLLRDGKAPSTGYEPNHQCSCRMSS